MSEWVPVNRHSRQHGVAVVGRRSRRRCSRRIRGAVGGVKSRPDIARLLVLLVLMMLVGYSSAGVRLLRCLLVKVVRLMLAVQLVSLLLVLVLHLQVLMLGLLMLMVLPLMRVIGKRPIRISSG